VCSKLYVDFLSTHHIVKAGVVQTGRDTFCHIPNFGCRHAESKHTDRNDDWHACHACGKVSKLGGPLKTYPPFAYTE